MTDECMEGRMPDQERDEEGSHRRLGVRRFDVISLLEGSEGASSVSLIRTPTSTVVVDTGSASSREKLLERIGEKGIKVEKVNVLVTTKADSEYSGNDELFVHALQHVQKDDWSKVEGTTNRRIAITNRYHWIDRYLRLQTLDFIEGGALVLLAHMPKRAEMLESSSLHLQGKIVLFAGHAVPSEDDPEVKKALDIIRSEGYCSKIGVGEVFRNMVDLLSYCDMVIPGRGPMFSVRK